MRISPKNNSDIYGIIHKIPNLKVNCSAKSSQQTSSTCWNAINPTHDFHFCSGSESDQWFQFIFPNILIKATHYSLQAPKDTMTGWYMPKSWEFFGIKENGALVSIDTVSESKLNEDKKIVTYAVDKVDTFVGFKLQMKGSNYQGSYTDLRIYKIDFFGSIKPIYGCLKSCACKKYQISRLICLCMNIAS